jgi:hypothetical protein
MEQVLKVVQPIAQKLTADFSQFGPVVELSKRLNLPHPIMLVFVASAYAGNGAWPCQRMNWGWRNVWTTCSINSYAPGTPDAALNIPHSFHTAYAPMTLVPSFSPNTQFLTPGGSFAPVTGAPAPQFMCDRATATGISGHMNANVRNRCRRALDAYGALVKSCSLAPNLGGNRPVGIPVIADAPHVSNVAGLTVNAQLCAMPTGLRSPTDLSTPTNTCPGLLGWFTVVFNACNFNQATALNPTNLPNAATVPRDLPAYFPPNGVFGPATFGTASNIVPYVPYGGAGAGGASAVGTFCTPYLTPNTGPQTGGVGFGWNQAGPNFRTSRCRKALDQFGRTANRCHQSTNPPLGGMGPGVSGGTFDPLRLLAVGPSGILGTPNQPATPGGMNAWTPLCN